MKSPAPKAHAFTLIELVVVILVIATLVALLVPAASRTLDRAKSAQAKNDVTQIVTAVNAFYTEYGKYPIATTNNQLTDAQTADLFYTLRAVPLGANALVNGVPAVNPRSIVFLTVRDAPSITNPRGGIVQPGGVGTVPGSFVDSWGTTYKVKINGAYDNQIPNPYSAAGGAGADPLRQGVIAWCLGKDKTLGKNGNNVYTGSDDIISWQ
jgi:prepilin-type N-terminal cleavage/methylation domain-containing protein